MNKKLTAVTVTVQGRKVQTFLSITPDEWGKVVLSPDMLEKLRNNIPRGTTISVG